MSIHERATVRRHQDKIAKLFATRRWCYYIPADGFVKGYGYRVSIVFEHESGHFPTGDWPYEGKPGQRAPWWWGNDFNDARAIAEEQNERLGISPREAAEIVASSMGVKEASKG